VNIVKIPLIGTQYQMVNMEDMEDIINENVESLININEDIGFIADHGALTLPNPFAMSMGRQNRDDLNNFQNLISQNYTLKKINLGSSDIPESLNCLILAHPTEKFTDYELYQLDQFLMKGKNLALFLDSYNEIVPKQQNLGFGQGPRYEPIDTGLNNLLSFYGVSLQQSYVLDENCFKQQMPKQFGGGERLIYFAPVIKDKFISKDFEFMKNIRKLVTIKISPLELNKEMLAQNGINARKVFSSSEKAWLMSGGINLNPRLIQPPKAAEEKQSYTMAYMLEGEFSSYFTDKEIPIKKKKGEEGKEPGQDEKPETDKVKPPVERKDTGESKIKSGGEFIAGGKLGKIFIMGSSELLKDNILDPEGRTPNAMFVLNVLDYLNNQEDVAIMRSKEQRVNPLEDTGANVKALVKAFNIAGLPVLVILSGLLILFRRHSRKNHIRKMFEK